MAKVIALLAAKTDEVRVTHWRLLQTYHPRWHIFGQFGPNGGFWVTPPLVFKDVRRLVAEAANGKRYRLIGEPGLAATAASFVECCATFDARLACTVDVTVELLDLRRRMVGDGSVDSPGM
ncbi:hypothetical protein [Cupriavidus taiwanensis]|uniref:hypothetical protein n=1 Tax=Cupriavidus taiwanensis TaxID=164546 RepID=UPI0011C05D78|nr:hypothetical protein [Cupriavidus taiwanensis]